ncbi:Uncharacterised protein [Actinobacillus seminis]|uniref:Uncharacterized protein n=1 Tax=Actinobacillus seminis TaxID=722 RepID=A0A380VGN1_9PAST|nr:Uncharacterised protein [Actinobacillus seminis]
MNDNSFKVVMDSFEDLVASCSMPTGLMWWEYCFEDL